MHSFRIWLENAGLPEDYGDSPSVEERYPDRQGDRPLDIVALRKEFATLMRNAGISATKEEWMDAVKKEAMKLSGGKEPSPEMWVVAANNAVTTCTRCKGTGIVFIGRIQKPDKCFRCEGKGVQNQDDYRRNWGHGKWRDDLEQRTLRQAGEI